MTIGEFSVRQPVLVNLVMIGVLLVGVFTFFSMPAELMPNVSMDEAVVWVAYPGVAPEEIEGKLAEIRAKQPRAAGATLTRTEKKAKKKSDARAEVEAEATAKAEEEAKK